MALLDVLLEYPLTTLFVLSTGLLFSRCIYHLAFHPIAHIPGPFLAKITSLWLYYHAYIGDEATIIHKAHTEYGPYVRVSPNEVDISDADAMAPIYVSKGGFLKAPCYANFDIDGHKTIFSATDVEHRARRAKAVVPMFSTKSIRENEAALYGCADRMVDRMEEEARTGRPVNILNIARSLAVDAVSTHLFQENYNGTSEKGPRLSVSAFVDAFVAVGRFFYLPTKVFIWLEWTIEKCMPDEHTATSMEVVDKFVDNLVDQTPAGSSSYPGRLIPLVERLEVKAQCKDLIFAGTDSTGMNFATLCRQMALNPDKYEVLRKEILDNANAGEKKQDVQALPYLSAVVRESLRISMANPTRLPHVVPDSGWTFKGTNFPAGTIVGCSAHELHFNEEVFPDPFSFYPERWLQENPEATKAFFAFGAGSRACIARNLATFELYMGAERLVERDVLRGARACQEKVEIYEWFNSSVKGEKIELVWEKPRV
ncbi:cytochrome P450 [Mollisia scopiformis]|uniref:Cytochrome P450 n=1 Tax=Mollisia scopiformis TaxID=149040 RepID=A0A194X1T7_MOLSC|nr:cytochrome P450 [Mollisia scopiformis]KUJ14165.1 cytochrome P450 [Mollisia scopiformis]